MSHWPWRIGAQPPLLLGGQTSGFPLTSLTHLITKLPPQFLLIGSCKPNFDYQSSTTGFYGRGKTSSICMTKRCVFKSSICIKIRHLSLEAITVLYWSRMTCSGLSPSVGNSRHFNLCVPPSHWCPQAVGENANWSSSMGIPWNPYQTWGNGDWWKC